MAAQIHALIEQPYGMGYALKTMTSIPIPDADYRNEKVIARALRELADQIESGEGFIGISTTATKEG